MRSNKYDFILLKHVRNTGWVGRNAQVNLSVVIRFVFISLELSIIVFARRYLRVHEHKQKGYGIGYGFQKIEDSATNFRDGKTKA